MVVIAIIGTLAAIAIPNFLGYRERVRVIIALEDLRAISLAIDTFYAEHDRYPNDLAEAGLAGKKDPWGNAYQYLNFDLAHGVGQMRKNRSLVPVNNDYDLYSMGPDGRSQPPFTARASQDDIVRANNGAYFGQVSNY